MPLQPYVLILVNAAMEPCFLLVNENTNLIPDTLSVIHTSEDVIQ